MLISFQPGIHFTNLISRFNSEFIIAPSSSVILDLKTLLTQISLMDFPILIHWMSPFAF